jgi:very-short-patch-repair endonuclease
VRLANGRTVHIDAAYVDLFLGFEIDGHRWHAARAQRSHDNRRLDLLANLGWDIRRFTYEQVVNDGPSVIRSIRAAIAFRSGART